MGSDVRKAFESTVSERIINQVPDMPDHVFSKQFEKKMHRLIKYGEIAVPRKITLKKMFIYITAAVIAACAASLSVSAVRDFFKNFFMRIFETHTIVESVEYEDAPTSIESIYKIETPDTFTLVYEDELYDCSPYMGYEYSNTENNYIYFAQYVKSTYKISVNTENHPLEYITIDGNDGYIIDLGNNEYYISWDNGDYIFDITGNIGKNQLINIAKSVQKVE